jgi:exodeoxyribonuclease VII small subunit
MSKSNPMRPELAAASGPTPTEPQPSSFDVALAELEQLVQRMESGDQTLEESLAAYRRGASLVAFCRHSLADVQEQVRILEADLLRPFGDADEGEA